MGCFDGFCMLTGTPVKHRDPIRFAIVAPARYSKDSDIGYQNDWYQFITPALLGVYNDYGSTDEKDIKEKAIWGFIKSRIVPALVLGKRGKAVFGELDVKKPEKADLMSILAQREARLGEESSLHLWYCHEWAYQAVLNGLPSSSKNKKERAKRRGETENFVGNLDRLREILADDVAGLAALQREEAVKSMFSTGFIVSEVFHLELCRKLFTGIGEALEELKPGLTDHFRQAVHETMDFAFNLPAIRGGIEVRQFFGPQHDEFEDQIAWAEIIVTNMKARYRKYRKDCDE